MKTKGENGKWEKGEMQRVTGNERERRVCKESEWGRGEKRHEGVKEGGIRGRPEVKEWTPDTSNNNNNNNNK